MEIVIELRVKLDMIACGDQDVVLNKTIPIRVCDEAQGRCHLHGWLIDRSVFPRDSCLEG